MAITNSVKNILLGFGTSGLSNSAVTTTTVTTTALTATATLPATALGNYGYVRLKVSGVAGSGLSNVVFTATDGTTTIYIPDPIAITAGTTAQGGEFTKPFVSDLNLRTFVAVVTGEASMTAATVDWEVYANEAAGGP
jgi:hypothetical protein